ncbi:MAG: hypothetical protein KC478_05865 [Bacteriovoracaceae bacterium]|nr:hypothetical protein [Bacteriovoracaceae bacterium]
MKKLLIGLTVLVSLPSLAKTFPQVEFKNGKKAFIDCSYDPVEACKRIDSSYTYGKDVECKEMKPSVLAESVDFIRAVGYDLFVNTGGELLNLASYSVAGMALVNTDPCKGTGIYSPERSQCQVGPESPEGKVGSMKISIVHLNERGTEWGYTRILEPGSGNSENVISSITCEK